MISATSSKLLLGKNLTYRESSDLFKKIFAGDPYEPTAKETLILLAKKGETAEEVSGCLSALQAYETDSGITELLDTCGTGGDLSNSLNISTLAAIVAAGAGCKVAKHGNRRFSSRCGSSDLIEALGVNLDAPLQTMVRSIRKNRLGYFHAPTHHNIRAKFQDLRSDLKIKTIFNLLGPLSNPLKLDFKLVGVSNKKTFDLYLKILKKAGFKRVLLVYGQDGMDEISTFASTEAALIEKGKVIRFKINASKLGFKKISPHALKITSTNDAKNKALGVLSGKNKGPAAEIVILNAGAAIWTTGKAVNLKEGIEMARRSIESGQALKAIKQLAENSKL